ncbi:MAG: hypothetical protein ABII13_02290 [Patescibacteria group bacterium]|nr:hypothetical protein [Patescibacteria group bacterium]MBU2508932.1 hypothetical protein [Patescibacteria group bacterium]
MRWDEWKFSARRAAQDHFVRWTTVSTVVLFVVTTVYFLIKMLPRGINIGTIVMHYNIYLGIDDVRAWQWLFAIPGIAFVVVLFDLLFAFGIFRKEPLASRTVSAIALASIILWSFGAFFLVMVNS